MARLFAIPTRDRQDYLLSGLMAWEEGLGEAYQAVEFLIWDSSGDGGAVLARELSRLPFARRIHHFDRALRQDFVRELALRVGQEPSFALESEGGPGLFGSSRNALLLLGAGSAFAFLDDDVRPDFRLPLDLLEDAFESDSADPTSLHPYNSEGDLAAFAGPIRGLPTGVYGFLEGSFEGLDGFDRRPAALNFGSWGDMGMPGARYLLSARLQVDPGIYDDETTYGLALDGRQVFRSVSAPTVGGLFFMPMHALMDARSLLPPFSPRGRGEDLLWGVSVGVLHPERTLAYSPWSVHHCPPPRVSGGRAEAVAWEPRINDLLIFELARSRGLGYEALGGALLDRCGTESGDFQGFYGNLLERAGRARMAGLQNLLVSYDAQPEAWARDLESSLAAVSAVLGKPTPVLPVEFPSLEALAAYMRDFARLFQAWPEIWQAALELGPDFLERSRIRP